MSGLLTVAAWVGVVVGLTALYLLVVGGVASLVVTRQRVRKRVPLQQRHAPVAAGPPSRVLADRDGRAG